MMTKRPHDDSSQVVVTLHCACCEKEVEVVVPLVLLKTLSGISSSDEIFGICPSCFPKEFEDEDQQPEPERESDEDFDACCN